MPNPTRLNLGGEIAFTDQNHNTTLIVGNAAGSGATEIQRLWGTSNGLAVDAKITGASTIPVSSATIATLAEQEKQTGHLSAIKTSVQTIDNIVVQSQFINNSYGVPKLGVSFHGNDRFVVEKLQQDCIEPFPISSFGTYDIVKYNSDRSFSDINFIKVSGGNYSDGRVLIKFYYYSNTDGSYVQFWTSILPFTKYGIANDQQTFDIPITAAWNDNDGRYGYIEVIDMDSMTPDFDVDIIIGHYDFREV